MISTRLTERLGLTHPIIQAPVAIAAGGRLAAAVSEAGALGLIGGGYGDPDWLMEQFDIAGDQSVGCGLIRWAVTYRLRRDLPMSTDRWGRWATKRTWS
jgi:nitronate monooxygenase